MAHVFLIYVYSYTIPVAKSSLRTSAKCFRVFFFKLSQQLLSDVTFLFTDEPWLLNSSHALSQHFSFSLIVTESDALFSKIFFFFSTISIKRIFSSTEKFGNLFFVSGPSSLFRDMLFTIANKFRITFIAEILPNLLPAFSNIQSLFTFGKKRVSIQSFPRRLYVFVTDGYK